MKYYLILVLCIAPFISYTQNYDPNHLPNTYRNADNPNYWKNKLPHECYWQQDVAYKMEVFVNDSTDIIEGNKYELTYWNNSPDTLHELYFHLYQNAFQPHSHMHDLYTNNGKELEYGKYEKQGLGTTVENILVNGQKVDTILDNTILKIIPSKPILPNTSVLISMKFKTYFDKGDLRRRMKLFNSKGEKHYDGVHWYPSICAYDKKFRWTTEQHLDKEFYSNFGSFDVKLTFAEKFVVDATGTLQNQEEVFPDSLAEKLDLKHFAKAGHKLAKSDWYDTTQTNYKTWHFYTENVHNFAFTADPNYRKSTIEWEGVKVVTLAQEKNAHKWQPSGEFTRKVIEVYSNDFGKYIWPKIIVADAADGMEYPMLTLDGGAYPRHQGLLAHEVGHMWFYGMIGSNETYRAFMDEGFTQFLTVWSQDKIKGREQPHDTTKPYINKHHVGKRTWYSRLYYPYTVYAAKGYDYPLNTHSSDFRGAVRHGGGYGLVYYKTGVMLYNLRYVLGDELFLDAMKYYFNKWKCAHPYPEDFRDAITEYTKVDLTWFFDQWLETAKNIDYSISKVKKNKEGNLAVTLKRNGAMQMPLDLEVVVENGDTTNYYIPNTWFEKKTDAETLPKWYGWGNLHPTYTFTLDSVDKVKSIEIDPTHTLADIRLDNNTYKKNYLKFENGVRNSNLWDHPVHYWRPDLWYTKYDGLQIGLHAEGTYFHHFYKYKANVWYNSVLGQYNINEVNKDNYSPVSFDLYAKEAIKCSWKGLYTDQTFKHYGGVWKGSLGIEKRFQPQDLRHPEKSSLSLKASVLYGPQTNQHDYLFYTDMWSYDRTNSFLDLKYDYKHSKKHFGYSILLRTPFVYSDFNYAFLEIEEYKTYKGKKLDFKYRGKLRLGTGVTPIESSLTTAGANSEELFKQRTTSANGIIPSQWTAMNNPDYAFHQNGGLNLRGYSGQLLTQVNGQVLVAGTNGASASFELFFERFLGIKKNTFGKTIKLHTYAFGDLGVIHTEQVEDIKKLNPLMTDLGLGIAMKIASPYYKLTPFTLTAEFPMYVNRPVETGEYFQSRMLIGIKTDL